MLLINLAYLTMFQNEFRFIWFSSKVLVLVNKELRDFLILRPSANLNASDTARLKWKQNIVFLMI
jgi:hypothetical protein